MNKLVYVLVTTLLLSDTCGDGIQICQAKQDEGKTSNFLQSSIEGIVQDEFRS